MENASKALIMAGGILIALLIIGSLIFFGTTLQSYQNSENENVKDSQIAEFNNQYEPYKKDGLTLMELKSLYNKIESNNKKNPEYTINTNISSSSVYPDKAKDFKEIEESDKINFKFRCIGTKYETEDGRISEILFEKT